MTRPPIFPFVSTTAFLLAVACGGSVDETGTNKPGSGGASAGGSAGASPGGAAGGGGIASGAGGAPASPVWAGKPNGTFVSAFVACQRITEAYRQLVEEQSCVYTGVPLSCPGFLANGSAGCLEYDLGTVAYCADEFLPQLSCAKFASHPCSLVARPTMCVEGD